MRYAIELTLDEPTAQALQAMKQRLAVITARPVRDAADPHITIGACDALDVPACSAMLSAMASAPPLPCRFDSLGIFATEPAVVFVAPVVTQELLVLHAAFHERVRPIATGQSAYYLPGHWVPHCTLAERIPPALVPDTVVSARELKLPITGRFARLRIVEIPDSRIMFEIAYPADQ